MGDFTGALNEMLRQWSQRAVLDGDEPDWCGRRQHFDRQNLEMHLLPAKAHSGARNKTKPASGFDQAHVKMERHCQYGCGWRFEAALSKHFILQRARQAARLRQHPRLSYQVGERQVSPFGPTTLGAGGDDIRFIKQWLG